MIRRFKPRSMNMIRRLKETVGELKKGETKHPTIVEKNSDEAEGKGVGVKSHNQLLNVVDDRTIILPIQDGDV